MAEAVAAESSAREALGRAEAAREGAARALEAAGSPSAPASPPPGVLGGGSAPAVGSGEDLEWYLLARLAAQRSVSFAGSVPVLLDEALSGLDDEHLVRVLDRLEPMAAAVQLIVLCEGRAAAAWALDAGPGRAAVVRPGPPEPL